MGRVRQFHTMTSLFLLYPKQWTAAAGGGGEAAEEGGGGGGGRGGGHHSREMSTGRRCFLVQTQLYFGFWLPWSPCLLFTHEVSLKTWGLRFFCATHSLGIPTLTEPFHCVNISSWRKGPPGEQSAVILCIYLYIIWMKRSLSSCSCFPICLREKGVTVLSVSKGTECIFGGGSCRYVEGLLPAGEHNLLCSLTQHIALSWGVKPKRKGKMEKGSVISVQEWPTPLMLSFFMCRLEHAHVVS